VPGARQPNQSSSTPPATRRENPPAKKAGGAKAKIMCLALSNCGIPGGRAAYYSGPQAAPPSYPDSKTISVDEQVKPLGINGFMPFLA
jgi:hypothetical protein